MPSETYVIVGAGVAGGSAAEALRSAGFDGRIVLLGAEPDAPYSRPPLSKQYLRGEMAKEKIFLHPPDFYERNRIERRANATVGRIDAGGRSLAVRPNDRLAFDKVLITTGAAPRRMGAPGEELSGIHYLRTVADCERIRQQLESRPRVVVIGTGFIGCEVAASARRLGCDVTLVGRGLPLQHVLGPEVGAVYASYHRSQGVDVRADRSVVEFRGAGRLEAAKLSDGSEVRCDAALIGIGVSPVTTVAPPELELDNGIATDEFCRTNVDGVYAAGDAASSWRPRLNRRVRFEHFYNAKLQGAAAGKAMAGKTQAYDPIPYFWSDQFDLNLQYYGLAARWDACVVRGSPGEYSFSAFYLQGGRIDAVCIVNRPQELSAARSLLGRTGIAPRDLADNADLAQLAPKAASSSPPGS